MNFCCPKCGVENPIATPVFAFEGSATAIKVICQHCAQAIPCPTCYGERQEDYITCWTCRRCPDIEPLLTDDRQIAATLQKLVRSYHHGRTIRKLHP